MKLHLERYPTNDNPIPILTARKDIAWEARAVFNPCVVRDDDIFRMLYRTYPSTLREAAPRLHRPGFRLKGQVSYIGYAESNDGIHFKQRKVPFIEPSEPYDQYGCEDPRITKLGETFYITYTAIDAPLGEREAPDAVRPNVRIALATTKDFRAITKHGIIGPHARSKAAAFFPEPVANGKIGMLLTVNADSANSAVHLRMYDSLEAVLGSSENDWDAFLSQTQPLLKTEWWLNRGPELGAPPLKTNRGWLLVYSAESMSYSWSIGAALLDLDEPQKLIARTPGSLLEPVTHYEREGIVPNVTFPEGAVIVGDELYVYYGAADTAIGLARCKLCNILDYVESFRGKK